jgi:hypothetical protein
MKRLWLILIGLVLAVILIFVGMAFRLPAEKHQVQDEPLPSALKSKIPAISTPNTFPLKSLSKLKSRFSDFTDAERNEFRSNFVARYKPAFLMWNDAFAGRVPLNPDTVTPEKFVERVGKNASYREYIFVVDGITLGIQDANGVARVDYLNDPKQTGKMTMLPSGGEAPISSTPVSKEELATMFFAEGGTQFMPNDIRLIPSGYSGALNGGAIVNVGGTPDNAASWKYDMVIAPDGKLAYYLKGK